MQSRVLCRVQLSSNSFSFLFFNLWYRFSAGVGRAGTFCVIYTAIRELNGTGNIGKGAYNENNYCHALFPAREVYCKICIFKKNCKFVSHTLSRSDRTVSILCHVLFPA